MMDNQKDERQNDKKVIINWLAHHNPNRNDFDDHVIYIFNHAVCLGCFAFLLGATVALIIGNIFSSSIFSYLVTLNAGRALFYCSDPIEKG